MGGIHDSQSEASGGETESNSTERGNPSSDSLMSPSEMIQKINEDKSNGELVSRSHDVGTTSTPGPNTSGPNTDREYERYYGVDIDAPGEAEVLQQLAETNGAATVRRWADEGIPVEAMGTPSKMDAYRQRKGTPVPWDAEKRNKQSKRRSKLVQRVEAGKPAGDTQVPNSVRDVISSPGQSLDSAVQREMEDRMGNSFSDVQVHTGPKAAQACDDINAKAFTVGNNIAFNSGEYDPSSQEGQHVLAHELAHVRQQTDGAVSMLPKENVQLEIDPDPKLEEEAEETAQRVMAGGKLDIQRMEDTDIHVQRLGLSDLNPMSSDDPDGNSKENLARRVEILENNQQTVFQALGGSDDIDLESVTGDDGGFENVATEGGYVALGEIVKASGTEGLKNLAIAGGLATAGSVGFPVALAAGVTAATAAGGVTAAAKNRDGLLDQLKGFLSSGEEGTEMQQEKGSGSDPFSGGSE